MDRQTLELKAAAILEKKRRDNQKRSKEKTVYGMVCPEKGLVRCWQEQKGKYVEVDKAPIVLVPIKMERAVIIPKAVKILKGGRGSGKSESTAGIISARVKDYGVKALCAREFQNSINDSVHAIINRKVVDFGFIGFNLLDSKIDHENGGKVRYRGLARNPEGVKSFDGFALGWVEEAQAMSKDSIELLEPTFRESGAEIWYTLNPGSSADPISKEHLKPYETELLKNGYYEDDQVMIIEMNYRDNPWFPEILDGKRKKNKEMWSTAKYQHVWEGAFSDEVENSIISSEWFDAAIDAHKKLGWEPTGRKIYSHDPSDLGNDDKGNSFRHGSLLLDCTHSDQGTVNDGCTIATGNAIQKDSEVFVWDGDGMGVALRQQVSTAFKGKKVEQVMFRGSNGVEWPDAIYQRIDDNSAHAKTNKQTFKNRRSQAYWELAMRFYKTYLAVVHGKYCDPDEMISISSDIEHISKLRSELCRIPLKPNANGLIQIMTKEEMRRLGIESPNMADSVYMAFSISVTIPKIEYVMPTPRKPVYGSQRNY